MKILVCISNVPDTTTKIRFSADSTSLDAANIQWIINPWDELALTRALELKEASNGLIEKVSVIHVGGAASEATIRKALAIGADDAVRINAVSGDAYFIAAQLAEAVKNESYDMILCGIESSDFNGSAVGSMLAEFLQISSVSSVSGLSLEGNEVQITREIDGGKEVLTVSSPFVAIVQKGIAINPRIAAMRGIMMARSKPIKVIEPVQIETLTEDVKFDLPQPKASCKLVDEGNVKELVNLLYNEAKVI